MGDPGIDSLLRMLYATLDATPGVRQQGEAGLAAAACQPGFGLALAHVAVSQELPYGIKQLAAVVLKQYVKVRRQRRRSAAFQGAFGCAQPAQAAPRAPLGAHRRVRRPHRFGPARSRRASGARGASCSALLG